MATLSHGRAFEQRTHGKHAAFAIAAALALVTWSSSASAQTIQTPGAHPRYAWDIEPHLVWQWDDNHYWDGDAWGLGVRATVPLIDNGPLTRVNNTMGIGFGLDITHRSGRCGWHYYDRRTPVYAYGPGDDCSGTNFWVPIVMQWNFYFTKSFALFAEPGFAIVHRRWNSPAICGAVNSPGYECDYTRSDTDPALLFFIGTRIHFTDSVALTLRIGWPYASVGASLLF